MITNLTSVIDKVVINTNARMLAVVRSAISDTIEQAQTPVAKGGRMRVKTGFLRASGGAALNAVPTGPRTGDRKAPDNYYSWKVESLNAVLARMKLGDTFYFGWTAHYAKIREVYDGFLETSVQNWQTQVNKAVQKFRNRDMKL